MTMCRRFATALALIGLAGTVRGPMAVSKEPGLDDDRPVAASPRGESQPDSADLGTRGSTRPSNERRPPADVREDDSPELRDESPPTPLDVPGTPSPAPRPADKRTDGPLQPSDKHQDRRAPATPVQPVEPVLPGRAARERPETPEAAAAAGRRLVQSAAAAARRGDQRAACRLALEACSVVAPCTIDHMECRRIMQEAEAIIERAGSRPDNRAGATRFE
jgi:hypothetical protein